MKYTQGEEKAGARPFLLFKIQILLKEVLILRYTVIRSNCFL